jgi:molybdopterin-guanine dinucleotide biosynthesis protein MobB
MMAQRPAAVSFVARSGTGKTTLVTKLIAELKQRGYRVGAIKHDAHKFEIDHAGKDSYRLTEAGADNMLISSGGKLAFVKQHQQPPEIEELLEDYFSAVDIVLVEGFRRIGLPKIELYRQGYSTSLICRGDNHDEHLLAVATDSELQVDVPLLNLNQPAEIVDFLLEAFRLE